MNQGSIEQLTPRQREILGLVAKGLTNDEIAGVLGIATGTVKTHVTSLMAALDVTNRTEAAALLHASDARAEQVDVVLARPAIAVLPFVALDEDRRTQTLGRAMAYDLAGLFAASCWFPVIAPISTENARALGTTCQQLGAALGARFLVDGALSVRGTTWRLQVHIDDTTRGECLWRDHHDFVADELFAVQDDVCAQIAAAAYPVMMQRVQRELRTGHDVAAWELAHQGMVLCRQRDARSAIEARARFEAALQREPTLVLAHVGLGLVAYDEALNQWGAVEAARARLLEAAEHCIDLAPHMGEGYFLRARYSMTLSDYPSIVRSLEIAIAKNPSFAQAHALLAQSLHTVGRSEDGLHYMRHALRLGPRAFVAGLALLHLMRKEYDLALEHAESAIAVAPSYTFARVVAAASAHCLGDGARANEHAQRLKRDYPPFDSGQLLRSFGSGVEVVHRIDASLKVLLP